MGVKIVKHQTFEELHVFEHEPDIEEVYNIIAKNYKKSVVGYERLDKENFLFRFNDKTTIELLLRYT